MTPNSAALRLRQQLLPPACAFKIPPAAANPYYIHTRRSPTAICASDAALLPLLQRHPIRPPAALYNPIAQVRSPAPPMLPPASPAQSRTPQHLRRSPTERRRRDLTIYPVCLRGRGLC
ncbi:MAG: hypothetical protein L0220_02845 [Acidobacteria bacterium]|nr:hypothetical protein [Acidobacteriota bacterium]